jgi:Arc/MetJ-type ribon-helix-helix transcriptional regulator
MSTQITVRLPDDLVAFLDRLVVSREVTSRAEAVADALRRQQRRLAVMRDIAILRDTPGDADLASLIDYVAANPVGLDD